MPRMGADLLVPWLLAWSLAACVPQSSETRGQLSSESDCYVAPDPAKCKFASALAGGPPMQVNGTDR